MTNLGDGIPLKVVSQSHLLHDEWPAGSNPDDSDRQQGNYTSVAGLSISPLMFTYKYQEQHRGALNRVASSKV